jgi:hypothetical protein
MILLGFGNRWMSNTTVRSIVIAVAKIPEDLQSSHSSFLPAVTITTIQYTEQKKKKYEWKANGTFYSLTHFQHGTMERHPASAPSTL